jgi:glycosyltransferase involved in cell wall biosynthesis
LKPVRLSVVLTHPIQYYAPWFKYITTHADSIDLKVFYCVTVTPEQQGVGFERPFTWDNSIFDGYAHEVIRKKIRRVDSHSSAFFGVTVPEVVSSIRKSGAEAVLVPGWYSVSLVAAAVTAKSCGIPVIYRGDSQLLTPDGMPTRAKRSRTKVVLGLFSHFLTVGKRNHEYLRQYLVPESRIFFSPHCVDNSFFSTLAAATDPVIEREKLGIPADAFVALFAGKLEEKKRPWELIEAAGLMETPGTVIIAGSGEAEDRCRRAAARSSANVIFLGFRNQTEIARVYALADCLVLPSDSGETWGLVVNEALAAGIPCIVSDQVGCGPDLIENGKTGYITPFAEISELANTLDRLRMQIESGHSFDSACRARAAAYSFATATAGLEEALMSAVSMKARR